MMRKPLGRGLDALIGDSPFGDSARSDSRVTGEGDEAGAGGGARIAMIAVGDIRPGKYQPRIRFDEDSLEELKRAILTQGIIEPLIVRPVGGDAAGGGPHFELIAGERRLRAARAAGLRAVPAIVRELDDRAALEMSIVENLVREELNAVEEAIAFARLAKHFAMSHDEIAARVGKSRPYVSNACRLLELPPIVIEMIVAGQLSAGQARPLLALDGAERQLSAARRIAAVGISARGAEELATHSVNRKPAKTGRGARSANDANVLALAEGLQRALKRKVRIFKRRGRSPGRIEIEYYDDNDLTAVAELLLGNSRARMQA
jgi:ParB family transcriptional regulator, chromosome partitioning protein